MADYIVQEEDGTSKLDTEESTADSLLLEEGGWTDHVLNIDDTVGISDSARLLGFGARVSQQAVEIVESPDDSKGRFTQQAVEVVESPDDAKARFTQQAVEVVWTDTGPPARFTQQAVEIVESPDDAAVRVSQQAVEVIYSFTEPPFKPRVWAWF